MKSQAALEFLTTYGFMFVLIGFALVIILFIATTASGYIPNQCSSVGGFNCNYVNFQSNASIRESVVTLLMTNAQSVPVEINAIVLNINNQTASGICGPQIVYPGATTSCAAIYPNTVKQFDSLVTGAYSINALLCNSGPSQLTASQCSSFVRVTYTGTFSTQALINTAPILVSSGAPLLVPTTCFNHGFELSSRCSSSPCTANAIATCPSTISFCNGAESDNVFGISSISWGSDANSSSPGNPSASSVGTVYSQACATSAGSENTIVTGALGLLNPGPYIVTANSFNGVNGAFVIGYTLKNPASVVISIACGRVGCDASSGSAPIALPSNCNPGASTSADPDGHESIYFAICNNQSAGSYTITGSQSSNTFISSAVYAFPG